MHVVIVTLAIIAMASTQSYSTDVPMYHITWQDIFSIVNCKDLTAFTLHEFLRLNNFIVQVFQCIKLAYCCGMALWDTRYQHLQQSSHSLLCCKVTL